MSNEISYTLQASLSNGDLADSWSSGRIQVDQTTARHYCAVIGVSTVAEAIGTGDVTGPLTIALRNLDDTNFVAIGTTSGDAFHSCFEIPAGGCAFLPSGASGVALWAEADTAEVDVEIRVYSE